MSKIIKIMTVAMFFFSAANAAADYGEVRFESKRVVAGQTRVTVDLTVHWDVPLSAIAIPMVVRAIDPGSFWTGDLPVDTSGGAPRGVTWDPIIPPWAVIAKEMRPGIPTGPCATDGDVGYDGISPDHFAMVAVGIDGLARQPDGQAIMTMSFAVTNTPGQFEFDQACFSSSLNRVFLVDAMFPPIEPGIIVQFDKGIITIADCDCAGLGDCDGDGAINPIDVVYMVNNVYRGGPALQELPGCWSPNGDWNCDDNVSPLDVVEIVNFVYRAGSFSPCNPCTGGNLPDLQTSGDDVYFNTNPVAVGEAVWIMVRVRNLGRKTILTSQLHLFRGDPDDGGIPLGWAEMADLAPGEVSGYFGGFFAFDTPGMLEIYGVADHPDVIVEVSESNNQGFRLLEVTSSGMRRQTMDDAKESRPIELMLHK